MKRHIFIIHLIRKTQFKTTRAISLSTHQNHHNEDSKHHQLLARTLEQVEFSNSAIQNVNWSKHFAKLCIIYTYQMNILWSRKHYPGYVTYVHVCMSKFPTKESTVMIFVTDKTRHNLNVTFITNREDSALWYRHF